MRKKMKQVIAYLMIAVLFFGMQTPQSVQAATENVYYSGGYSIEQILTYYQYFTRGDCELGRSAGWIYSND